MQSSDETSSLGKQSSSTESMCRRKDTQSYSEFGIYKNALQTKYGSDCTHLQNLKSAEIESLKSIGFGRFSIVKRGYSKKYSNDIAVKIVLLRDKANRTYLKKYLPQEIRLWKDLSSLNHKNILLLTDYIKTPKYLYLITENVDRGNLHEYLLKVNINESRGRTIFRDIANAVGYCHSKRIAHRDIKPENILIDRGETIRLADFSFVTTSNPVTNEHCGTRAMLSPEQRARKSYNPFISDLWQVGLTLYMMLFRRLPYKNHKKKALLSEIQGLTDHYRGVPYPEYSVSLDCKELISGMLTINPRERLTIDDVFVSSWLTPVVSE